MNGFFGEWNGRSRLYSTTGVSRNSSAVKDGTTGHEVELHVLMGLKLDTRLDFRGAFLPLASSDGWWCRRGTFLLHCRRGTRTRLSRPHYRGHTLVTRVKPSFGLSLGDHDPIHDEANAPPPIDLHYRQRTKRWNLASPTGIRRTAGFRSSYPPEPMMGLVSGRVGLTVIESTHLKRYLLQVPPS